VFFCVFVFVFGVWRFTFLFFIFARVCVSFVLVRERRSSEVVSMFSIQVGFVYTRFASILADRTLR